MNKNADDKTVIHAEPMKFARARLICLDEMLDESLHGLEISLGCDNETLGRDESNSICIKYNKLSRRHVQINFLKNQWEIEDLNSANGTFINEQAINKATMGHGDIIVIGQIPFRFEIDFTAVEAESTVDNDPIPNNYTGDAGTMYAQHIGVLESLADHSNAEPVAEDPQPVEIKAPDISSATRSNINSAQPIKEKSGFTKYLIYTVIICSSIGGYLYWESNNKQRQAESAHREYSHLVQIFLENHESINNRTSDSALIIELGELELLSANVDLAVRQHQQHAGLNKLEKQIIFLVFEREFLSILRNKQFLQANEYIATIQNKINSYIVANKVDDTNYKELLEMASATVKFKQFSARFPNPSIDAPIVPDTLKIQEMTEIKSELTSKKKQNYLLLSVTYSRFQQLLKEVEEIDFRLLNRWSDILRRAN